MTDSSSSQAQAQELPPGTQLGNFTITRMLGQGGFGITYLARDGGLDMDVVIKENLPTMFAYRDTATRQVHALTRSAQDGSWKWAVDNFIHEARLLAKLNHPNIVKVLQVFPAYGTDFFVMPFVEGESLDMWRERNGAPTEAWLRSLLLTLLDALSYLHGREINHRDIKPANILMTAEGTPVLIDFGAARQRMGEKTQTVMESAGYTPLEQVQTSKKVGPWSDIYALGCTLYKLITGDTPPKSVDRVGDDPVQPLSARAELRGKYSQQLLAGIDRAMAFRESERWQSAAAWAASLEGSEPLAEPAAPRERASAVPPHHTQISLPEVPAPRPEVAATPAGSGPQAEENDAAGKKSAGCSFLIAVFVAIVLAVREFSLEDNFFSALFNSLVWAVCSFIVVFAVSFIMVGLIRSELKTGGPGKP